MPLMDAIVKTTAGPGLELKKVPIPEPGQGEVLIKVHKTAICGTDVHIYDWNAWSASHVKPPMVIGHEYVGEVSKLGPGVTDLQIGQRVSGEGHITCGVCRNCRNGNIQWCNKTNSVGVDRNGAFAEYVCIPASNVIIIDTDMDENIVAMFDAVGNAAHTALSSRLTGEDVLITGVGPVGLLATAICAFAGAKNVVVTDVNEYRLNLAKEMSATAALNVENTDLEQEMKKLGIREGFDVALEMSGNGTALKQILPHMRNGGEINVLGISNKPVDLDMNLIVNKGLTIRGIYGRKYDNWYQIISMVKSGLNLKPAITHHFSYEDFEKGFEIMHSGKSGKVILNWV